MTIALNLSSAANDAHERRALSEISLSIVRSKKIIVVTGAGISCSCGIPDFRSSDGLYALVKQKYPAVVMKGRDLFDASLFRDATSTAVFYSFISGLKRSVDAALPTPTHHFIKTLDAKKKLLRSYTQNIDGLEERVGLLGTSCVDAKTDSKGKCKLKTRDIRNVQLHGDIHRVRCMSCSAEYPCTDDYLSNFEQGTPPDCPECLARSEARVARSARAIKVGTLRPAIVLYDEPHPLGDDIGIIQTADINRKPDLLIIMGTSLKVHGLKKLVKDFAKTIRENASLSNVSGSRPRPKVIFVNKTAPSAEWADIIDYHITGETDAWVMRVIEDWKKMKPVDWETQQTLVVSDGDLSMASPFKVSKPGAEAHKAKKGKAGDKKTTSRNENEAPALTSSLPQPPLSPSKRRQGVCHYDDLESSPSKRQLKATSKILKHALPASERKMLFGESTNNATSRTGLDGNRSTPMDISLVDLSMRDIAPDIDKPIHKTHPTKLDKASTTKSQTQRASTAKRRLLAQKTR